MAALALGAPLLVSFSPDDGYASSIPYAERVPADAAMYVAVPDLPALLDALENQPHWIAALGLGEMTAKLARARRWLSGPAAFYAVLRDGRLRWTALVRLKNGRTHVDGEEVSSTRTMASFLERFENDPPRTHVVVRLPEWSEFSRAILEVEVGRELTLRGRAIYRTGQLGEMLERRVHAPGTPRAGDAPIAHSGLTDVEQLCSALRIAPPAPPRILKSLGPAWGMEIRSRDEMAFWFEARGDALKLRPTRWNGFQVEVRDGRVEVFKGRRPEPGAPGAHAQSRIDGDALREWIPGVPGWLSHVETRTRYRSAGADVELRIAAR